MTALKQICMVVVMTLTSSQCFAVATTDTQSNAASYSNSSGQTQGFVFAPNTNTSSTYYNRTISPVYGAVAPVGGVPQNFLEPGVSANAMADPLVWYYLDALASSCEEEPEIVTDKEKLVTLSFQPDCGVHSGINKNSPLGEVTATVAYKPDLDDKAFYVPLGMISASGEWDDAEDVNLLTLVKSVQRYVKKNIKGYDNIIIVNDILRKTVATQRSTEASSEGFSVSPSISSAFGRDSLVGNIIGYGSSNGSARPLSRKGATFVVLAVSPGPWLGVQPRLSQKEYFKQFIALPQQLNTPPPTIRPALSDRDKGYGHNNNNHDKDDQDTAKPMTPVELETKALTR